MVASKWPDSHAPVSITTARVLYVDTAVFVELTLLPTWPQESHQYPTMSWNGKSELLPHTDSSGSVDTWMFLVRALWYSKLFRQHALHLHLLTESIFWDIALRLPIQLGTLRCPISASLWASLCYTSDSLYIPQCLASHRYLLLGFPKRPSSAENPRYRYIFNRMYPNKPLYTRCISRLCEWMGEHIRTWRCWLAMVQCCDPHGCSCVHSYHSPFFKSGVTTNKLS